MSETTVGFSEAVIKRFWSKVDKSKDCWEWRAGRFTHGYGAFWFKRKLMKAHRMAYLIATGHPIPDDTFVCHTCDNRACVRPDHLFLGNAFDNMGDAAHKGRMPRGDGNVQSKIKAADVLAIRMAFSKGETGRQIGRRFGITFCHAYRIIRGECWAHIK